MNIQDRLYKSKKFRFWLLLLLTGICSLLAWIITRDRSITGFVAVLMGVSFWAVIENQRRRIRRKKTGEEIDWRSITYTEWLGLPSIKPLPKDAVTFKRCKNKELDELRRSIQMMSNDPGNYHSGIWMVLAYKAASKYLELEPALPRDIEFSCKKFLAFTAWQKEIWMISSSEDEAPEGVFAYGDLFIQAGSNLSELIGKFQQWWKQHPGSKPFSKFDQTFWPMLEYLTFILEIQLRNSKPIES